MQYLTIKVSVILLCVISIHKCSDKIDDKYYLASEAYHFANDLFLQSREWYNQVKQQSLDSFRTFLDIVRIMNDLMAREMRGAVIKYYRIRHLHDFTNYVISLEDVMEIVDHCLLDPVEKLQQTSVQFEEIIKNFEDTRTFELVEKCRDQLPDEVAVAHCMLHQAVVFNETMRDSLITIVKAKTRQNAIDVNQTVFRVHTCLTYFVPNIFNHLLIKTYTDECDYLKMIVTSIKDLLNENKNDIYDQKWSHIVKALNIELKKTMFISKQSLTSLTH